MNKILRSVAAVAASAALTVSGAAYYPSMPAPDSLGKAMAADDCNDDWLHAKGSRLYDMNGNEVWITGANWFGFNCSENCAHGLYARDVDDMLQTIADHGINTLRLPISSELIVSWMNGKPNAVNSVQASYTPPKDEVGEDGKVTPAGYYTNINKDFVEEDGKTVKNSMEIFDIIMQKCKKYGIKAFIDIHSPDANNSGHNYELWYGKAGVTTDVWIDSLTWLAKKYANDDTLIGYDLKNEPHGKRGYKGDTCPSDIAKWDGSTDENNWAYAAKKCADSILAVNPNALIFIEGIEQYPMTEKGYTFDTADVWEPKTEEDKKWHGAWWGGNLRGVRDNPVVPASGTSQIVYSPHDYGPSVYAQTWFDKDFTTQTLLDDYWYDTWAYINAEDIAPLLIGEWGGHMDKGANQKWMELLRDYMIDHHINHTFWCINPNSGDTGGLLDPTFMNWDKDKYALFEKSLWQTDAGKYIGLDHQTALGANGLSLNEFYSSGAKSNLDGGKAGGGTPVIVNKTTTTATKPVTTTTTTKPTATTTTVTTTAPVKTVKCEHCGKEIPESEAIYGPLGFPVCQECYDNGVYIGTSAPPPTTSTTTTTVTTTATTTPEPTPSTHPGYNFKSVESYPTKTVYNVGEKLDLSGLQFSGTKMQGAGSGGRYTDADIHPSIVTISDGAGKSVDFDKFNTLPAGEYTVNIKGGAGDYYKYTYCYGVDISYKVTIKESSEGPNKTDAQVWGDANNDGGVDMADVVLIMQSLANPNKYGLNGSDKNHITAAGLSNSSVINNNGSVTTEDALRIQLFLLGKFDPKASK
ncbi:MAG: cellulase family glycosylhydrolase [Ruminococcus sp.]|nr:cellulase family glycosylhydrolase [Ruminococcus sp.]